MQFALQRTTWKSDSVESILHVVVASSSSCCFTQDVSCVGGPSVWPRTRLYTLVKECGHMQLRTPLNVVWLFGSEVHPPVVSCSGRTWSCPLVTESVRILVDFKFKHLDESARTLDVSLKVPYYTVFPSISHSCQRSNNSDTNDMYCPKHICGPEFQLSKSRFAELYSERSVSVPAPLNANELRLSTPTWGALPAASFSGRGSPLC